MKNLSSDKKWFWGWGLFHGLVIAAFLVSLLFTKGFNVNADFSTMMPSASSDEAILAAENTISATSNNSVFVLVSNADFNRAREDAVKAYDSLQNDSQYFDSISLYADYSQTEEIRQFLGKYRYNLMSEQLCQRLNNGDGSLIAENALSSVYSGMMTDLSNIEEDPFLIDEENLNTYLKAILDSGTALGPKDGVLATQFNDVWYVMIRGVLNQKGAKLASKENGISAVFRACSPLEKDGTKMVYYGTPFHSNEASSNASAEISIIGTVSMLAVIAILFFVFRSGLPLGMSVFSIILSVTTAFCATHLVFGNLHVISLVFGTSLIGSCIDYSLHYFVNWKHSKELDSTDKIRRHLFNGLILSLVSTEICFALVFFAPFEILRQMAVFSCSGILSSFLTVNGLFTKFKLPQDNKREIHVLNRIENSSFKAGMFLTRARLILPFAVLFATSLFLLLNNEKVRIHNDIRSLYQMQGRLKEDTILAYQVINYSPSSWIVISGSSAEEVLQNEEDVLKKIPEGDKPVAVSRFIPSLKKQASSALAAQNLIPLAGEQFEYMGAIFDFDSGAERRFVNAVKASADNKLTPQDENLPQSLKELLKTLWIGEVNGRYYSVVLISSVSEESLYHNLAAENPNVHFQNKVQDISAGLDKLTGIIVLMFGIAFAIIAVVMKFFYSWRDTVKILSIPVLSVLVILTVFTALGLNIEFFCVTGIILVFGLGLDYVIYKVENKENKTESFAIFLSFLTTAISFGALALSSFVPVHTLGLSIFSGLVAAFIFAVL